MAIEDKERNMDSTLVGVIPAAGKGIRLLAHASHTHKTLLKIGDMPIIERNIIIMRDALKIRRILILVGEKKDLLIEYLGDGKRFGVEITYITVPHVEKGLAVGLLEAEPYIEDLFCVILGDEFYYQSNHSALLDFLKVDFSAVCAVKEVNHPHVIKKNYSVQIDDGLIKYLEEKPQVIRDNYLGCGTYIFRKDIFQCIRNSSPSPKTKRVELTDVINKIAKDGKKVYPFILRGNYMNVNNIEDYNAAQYMLRSLEFHQKKVSLIIPARNEELSIGYVIDDFKNKVNEIIVVNNNSKDETAKIAERKGAKVLTGCYKGYGDALKYGMDNASGDILILTEADGSFYARDLNKILEYLKDADMVVGTRTTKQMIEQAANMSFLLRWGNVFVAKLIELLWIYKNEPRLTDVGCTYRGIWKSVYQEMRGVLTSTGPDFSPEMIIEAMHYNKRIIEIPITYTGRIGGESKFSKTIFTNARTALIMLKMIFCKKIKYLFK